MIAGGPSAPTAHLLPTHHSHPNSRGRAHARPSPHRLAQERHQRVEVIRVSQHVTERHAAAREREHVSAAAIRHPPVRLAEQPARPFHLRRPDGATVALQFHERHGSMPRHDEVRQPRVAGERRRETTGAVLRRPRMMHQPARAPREGHHLRLERGLTDPRPARARPTHAPHPTPAAGARKRPPRAYQSAAPAPPGTPAGAPPAPPAAPTPP